MSRMSGLFGIPVFIIIAVVFVLFFVFSFVPVRLWISALSSGVHVGIFTLIGMRLRRVRPDRIIQPLIRATKANVDVTINQLESHYLSGGSIETVINAIIAAQRANLGLNFEQAAAIDLAGRDVFEAVQMSVTPKIIETPWISAVAKNGIEVKVIARVTVRTNLEKLVGGAGEETIIARIGEGIVTTVGSSRSHEEVLENPDSISQVVLSKGLDVGTAYEILSIDIADVDVGRNIGAQLLIEQAEADKNIAQSRAEERRSLAVAHEQEMIAHVSEMRAKVVEAEAAIPLAIANAIENGRMGYLDYYEMQNLQADTKMRESLGSSSISTNISPSNQQKKE